MRQNGFIVKRRVKAAACADVLDLPRPSLLDTRVLLAPDGAWTKVKVEVRGEQARLYVPDNEQPTLIVKDVKSEQNGHGGVALWFEPDTVAHFRNLTVEPCAK